MEFIIYLAKLKVINHPKVEQRDLVSGLFFSRPGTVLVICRLMPLLMSCLLVYLPLDSAGALVIVLFRRLIGRYRPVISWFLTLQAGLFLLFAHLNRAVVFFVAHIYPSYLLVRAYFSSFVTILSAFLHRCPCCRLVFLILQAIFFVLDDFFSLICC